MARRNTISVAARYGSSGVTAPVTAAAEANMSEQQQHQAEIMRLVTRVAAVTATRTAVGHAATASRGAPAPSRLIMAFEAARHRDAYMRELLATATSGGCSGMLRGDPVVGSTMAATSLPNCTGYAE